MPRVSSPNLRKISRILREVYSEGESLPRPTRAQLEWAMETLLFRPRPKKRPLGKTAAEVRKERRAARNEKWAAIREAVMKRADGKCENCGRAESPANRLEAHHLLKGNGRRRQMESVETVLALCVMCHRYAHGERTAEAR